MTPLCQVCSHRHTTDLTSLSPSGCADHAWSDACPYVGTRCPPPAERDEITRALHRPRLDAQARPLMLSGPRRLPPSMNDLIEAMERISYPPPGRTEPIKLTPGQWAVIQAANPPLADRPINPLYRPLGDLLGITVVMVADESECTPVVEGWLKPKPAPYPRRWWQRLWRWR